MPKQPRDPNRKLTPYQAAPQIENVLKRADAKRAKLRAEFSAIDADTTTRIDAIRARVDDEEKLDALLKAGVAVPEWEPVTAGNVGERTYTPAEVREIVGEP